MTRIRLALRVIGAVLSLASFGAMVTARGQDGELSVLERIPALMSAIEARAREHDGAPAADGDQRSVPDESVAVHAGVPSDAVGVRVRRGLP